MELRHKYEQAKEQLDDARKYDEQVETQSNEFVRSAPVWRWFAG